MTKAALPGRVLIYTIHRVEPWWRHVGGNLGFEGCATVSDLRGEGDFCVVDDFYRSYHRLRKNPANHAGLLSPADLAEIRARCRVLRWLPRAKAEAMAMAMAEAFVAVLDRWQPTVILSFPIDRYVSDILERLGRARGIPFYEVAASALPNMGMLLQRGALVQRDETPDPGAISAQVNMIATPTFVPSYVATASVYTRWRFLKIISYFRLRALVFWIMSIFQRDPLNLHYLDSQIFLGHKPCYSDIRIVSIVDRDWRARLDTFPQDRRIFMALQLFPEASIDYWIDDLQLIEHEPLLLEVAQAFSSAGFLVLVKDHPLQFGFRQMDLIDKLRAIPNVVILPYEVSGNEVLSVVGANFTCTGTLGLQAALAGLVSVVTPSYYANEEDFVVFRTRSEVERLPERVINAKPATDIADRRARIVAHLMRGSFACEFFSFKGFDAAAPSSGSTELGRVIGRELMHHVGCLRSDKQAAAER